MFSLGSCRTRLYISMITIYLIGVIVSSVLLGLQYREVQGKVHYGELIVIFIAGSLLSWITVYLILYYKK